ncbi:MAG: AAA family ATPase, partial [Flavobacteriaceae bacterium]
MIPKKAVYNSENQLETSFVPEILKRQLSANPKWQIGDAMNEDHTALLWVDVCNFSSLCNRLMKDKANGVEKITAILNDHYDFLLNVITEHGGEPLFFVGDAIMSAWPGEQEEASQSITLAISCANEILANNSTIDDCNELLQLHTVISYGKWHMSELESTHNKKLLTFYGEVFDNLRLVSQNRAPNQILIYNSALALLPKKIRSKAVQHNSSILIDGHVQRKAKVALKKNSKPLSKNAIERLKKFIPSTIADPISRERMKWIAEIRPVTIIFLGFHNIGKNSVAKRDEMVEITKIAKKLVVKYDGLLNLVWMDEKSTHMLICFGPSPSAHSNNPERSAKLAFELNMKLKQEGFENSIGVCTGIAYCGILGNDILRQHTVIGDVVNLSSRYAEISDWDIVCDQSTYKASKKSINFHEPFKAKIKGHLEPIELYPIKDIIGEEKLTKETELPFLIWHNELSHLIKTFDEKQDINNVIIIEGQSGMGKSILLQEFEIQTKHKWKVISTSANEIDRHTPYNVWREIFSKLLNFNALDTDIVQNENLERIENKFGERACLLNIVLNTNFADSELVRNLIASQKVRATHDMLLKILKAESKMNKLTIVIDNAQWMDEISWQLIESVSSEIKGCNIVLAFQKVKGIDHVNLSNLKKYELVILNELSERGVRDLLRSKLNITMVSDEVVMLVQKIAKGNPFFCFEFVDSLLDKQLLVFENDTCSLKSDVVISELSLPETVRGAVRSRIDRLDQGSQLSLKVGSVVGHRFGKGIVSEIYPILEERKAVSYYLEEAQRSGFLNDTLVDEHEGYLFNNATTAEVAYEMILTEQKRHLHKESAEWYEKNFKDKLQPFYVRLSHHWLEAGEKNKAIKYCQMESTRLFQLGFVQQALEVGLEGAKWLNYDLPRKPESISQKIGEHMG